MPSPPPEPLKRHSDQSGPIHRSLHGGLWPDRVDAEQLLDERLARAQMDDRQAALFQDWMRDGFVVLEGAVEPAQIEAVEAALESTWSGVHPRAHVEYWKDGNQLIEPVQPEHRALMAKLLDLHAFDERVRQAIFSPRALEFLNLLFERAPMAFQTLTFQRGTEQPIHQDTAYVIVDKPMELVGSWLALEDVVRGSGELEYYVGSHRLPEFDWGSDTKGMPAGHPEHDRWMAWLHEQAAELGLERRSFCPKRGDLLLWHADLAHGGTPVHLSDATRRSLVTHYCPVDRAPGYFAHHPHSLALPHASGAAYCYPCRWDPEPPQECGPSGLSSGG